jgi:hypothetical protein
MEVAWTANGGNVRDKGKPATAVDIQLDSMLAEIDESEFKSGEY